MKPKNPKKFAAVLRKAAELILDESQTYCCCAIDAAHYKLGYSRAVEDTCHTDVENYFHAWLKPVSAGKLSPYYSDVCVPDCRQSRVNGLLLVALLADKNTDAPAEL